MPVLELTFASKEDSLSVRRFSIREEMSGLFDVSVIARSQLDDIDFEGIVGKGATFRIVSGVAHASAMSRVWTGVCSHMEQVQAESTGLSTYYLRIVPGLWRTTQRRNIRIFQHLSIPDIVKEVLLEWEITPELKIDAQYPKYEYRVQYMETDFAFVSRLLEEAGIAFYFDHGESTVQGQPPATKLVLHDKPHTNEARGGGPIGYVDSPNQEAEQDFVTHVRIAQRVKPGHFTVRDFDFRTKPDYQLIAEARSGIAHEDKLEQYLYLPGAFLVEPGRAGETPIADDRGIARVDEREAGHMATRGLEGERRGRRSVTFTTNALDLSPGMIFQIGNHARTDLASDKKLLVTECSLEGTHDAEWTIAGEAVFADYPYRPLRKTPRPRIQGVQSAVVVGPSGEEIHTDEFGRVRVQFHWDREGTYNDESSCWIRVSQGWAGSSYGMMVIPRVGQEVLVEFYDGDPDRPVIVGRVFNNTTRIPYKLPENKTKSGWKSDSSPGSNGFNELSFEDAKGREVIHIQAEKDFTEIIKNNQSSTVLANRSAQVGVSDSVTVGDSLSFQVGSSESHTVGSSLSYQVGESRSATIGSSDTTEAGDLHSVTVASGTGVMITDKNILSTTGQASITMSEGQIFLDADVIMIRATTRLILHGGEVQIDGGPNTFINCGTFSPAEPATIGPAGDPSGPSGPGGGGESSQAAELLEGQGEVEPPGGYEEATVNEIAATPPASPGAAPPAARIAQPAAAQINQAVGSLPPVASLATAARGALAQVQQGMQLIQTAKQAIQTGGRSLLQLPAVQGAIGSVVTQPILGGMSMSDVAGLMNQGSQLGIFHLGQNATSALEVIRSGAASGGNPAGGGGAAGAVGGLLGGGGAAGALGGLLGGGGQATSPGGPAGAALPGAGAGGITPQALQGAGLQQFMGVRTQTAPPQIDGATLTQSVANHQAAGLPAEQAQATALAEQGVALYRGDFTGRFTKVG